MIERGSYDSARELEGRTGAEVNGRGREDIVFLGGEEIKMSKKKKRVERWREKGGGRIIAPLLTAALMATLRKKEWQLDCEMSEARNDRVKGPEKVPTRNSIG